MSKPVIYVPGLPASHLHERATEKRIFLSLGFNNPQLEGPNDLGAHDPVRAGEPIRRVAKFLFFDLAKQAESLYDLLGRFGIKATPFGWDWRRPVWDLARPDSVQRKLAAKLAELHPPSGPQVTVIVHSTGGLVLRALLERQPDLCRHIERVIAFGVPWAGTLKSLRFINGQSGFAGIVPASRTQKVLTRSWAAFDLLPPDPTHLIDGNGPLALTFRRTAQGDQPASALVDRDWINSLPSELRAAAEERAVRAHGHLGARRPQIDTAGEPLEIVNVVGWGADTDVSAELIGQGTGARLEIRSSKGDATLDGGDKTVPRRSAAWLASGDPVNVRTYHVPVGRLPSTRNQPHSSLWSNPGGINLLEHLCGNQPSLAPFCYAAIDGDDAVAGQPSVRVRLVALAADGSPLPGAKVRTRGLIGGDFGQDFRPAFDGRHMITLERQKIPRVGNPPAPSRVRRLRLQIGWQENGRDRWQERRFLIPA